MKFEFRFWIATRFIVMTDFFVWMLREKQCKDWLYMLESSTITLDAATTYNLISADSGGAICIQVVRGDFLNSFKTSSSILPTPNTTPIVFPLKYSTRI